MAGLLPYAACLPMSRTSRMLASRTWSMLPLQAHSICQLPHPTLSMVHWKRPRFMRATASASASMLRRGRFWWSSQANSPKGRARLKRRRVQHLWRLLRRF